MEVPVQSPIRETLKRLRVCRSKIRGSGDLLFFFRKGEKEQKKLKKKKEKEKSQKSEFFSIIWSANFQENPNDEMM
jgi:hypothetical protein